MKPLRKSTISVIAIVGFIVVLVSAIALAATGSGRQTANNLWLSNFLGDEVVITFIAAPPGVERIVKGTLMDAEVPGIVLKLGKDEIFFSYSNIICVEPAPD